MSPHPSPTPPWAQVLQNIEDALAHLLQQTPVTPHPPEHEPTRTPESLTPVLARLEGTLSSYTACVDHASAMAASADAALAETADGLQTWLSHARPLAGNTGSAVS